ncbi:acyl-ACP--UDP-N-acetylglucosamine O-acyltransferase [Rouxiella sp. WC2420]|uniref:Acyl-ACP--UDP-N-acetylglucosamine O-acyltransferase n=1 Tax=Rouxiella sp. WC2420 TaxID=3234145 RepID=A0AB39VVD8_9GAMM
MIHSSAVIARNSIIEKGAIIGANVRVGPFCYIQSNVEIGEGTVILSHAVINGHTRIGRENIIDSYCSLGEINQDLKYAGEATRLEIGHRNRIGGNATFHRGTVQGTGVTKIGDDNVFMEQIHLGHDCAVGNFTHFGLGAVLAGHVEIDDYVQLEQQAAVHQFCIIGTAAKILALSCVVQDIPPFFCVEGNRCRPIGINEQALARLVDQAPLRQIILNLYHRMYYCGEALETVREEIVELQREYPLLQCFEHFFARSKRGVIR